MIKKIETKQIKTIWAIDTLDVMINKTIITQKIISGKVVTCEKSCYIMVAKALMKYEK